MLSIISFICCSQIKDSLDSLMKEKWDEKRGKELVNKLKDAASGFGAVKNWTADTVKRCVSTRFLGLDFCT